MRCRCTGAGADRPGSAWRAAGGRWGSVRANEYAVRFAVDGYELTVFADGRAIIKGTSETGVARSLYARYIG